MTGPAVVIVGAGHLGTFHAEKLEVLGGEGVATLAGVVDIDAERRHRAAQRFGVPVYPDLDALPFAPAAAIISTPTASHGEIAARALALGAHVLVEKPLAQSVAAGRDLVARAGRAGRLMQVGHSERFNPAVMMALSLAAPPCYIVSERLSPFSGRSTDDDVILDLMIHDLDLAAAIVQSDLVEVRAIGVPVLTREIDMASARLAFGDGSVAQLSCGRVSLETSRKLRLFTPQRYLSVDCLALEVKSVRRMPPETTGQWPAIAMEPIEIEPGDALLAQDRDFFRCIRDGDKPRVDGAAGLRALVLVEAVRESLTVPVAGESRRPANRSPRSEDL